MTPQPEFRERPQRSTPLEVPMDQHPAITVSRSLGSEGTEVGFHVARRLGWHFCDRRILRLTADATGHTVATMALQEERPARYLDWLMTTLALGSPEAPCTPTVERPIYSRELFSVQRKVMLAMVEHAPSVLVGRGAFVALKDRPDTLHVSIHADLEWRVASLVRRGKVADAHAAREAIEASDRGRATFIKEISGLDWRDPRSFDLVLDTSKASPEDCLDRILAKAQASFGVSL